jgi:hypothetical protein
MKLCLLLTLLYAIGIDGFVTPKSEFVLEVDGNGIALSRDNGCVLTQKHGVEVGGKLFCWGDIVSDTEISSPPEDINFVQIVAGSTFKCGIAVDQTVHCWGSISGMVPGLFTQITSDCDSRFACGIQIDGKIICWGRMHVNRVIPEISGRFIQISCSERHCCALDDKGYPHCWGPTVDYPTISWKEFKETADNFGWSEEITIGENDDDYADDDNPAPIVSDDDKRLSKVQFRQISVTKDMSCGITLIGAHLRCWGKQFLHMRGRWPVSVKGPFRQVSAGGLGVCAIVGSEEDLNGDESFLKVASAGTNRHPDSLECFGPVKDYVRADYFLAWDQIAVGVMYVCGVSMDSQLFCGGMITPNVQASLMQVVMA